MRYLVGFTCLIILGGCGEKNTATAPVDNIQDNINTGEQLKKTVKDIGKGNADATDKVTNDNLKIKQ